jgi:TolB protein
MAAKRIVPSLLAALACATLLVLEQAQHASGAFPGHNGQVVFTSAQTGHRHIFITTAGGTVDLTAVSSTTAIDADPRFSPDGQRIAFTRQDSAHFAGTQIFTMSPSGTGVVQLTNTVNGNSDPTWSPDGSQIAFVSGRNGNQPNIFIMSADGTQVRQITNDPAAKRELAWSPRGDRIAFVRARTSGLADIYTIKTDGSGLTDLTNDPSSTDSSPSYSPDGSQIAYGGPLHPKGSVGGDLWIMNADGSGAHPLEHETNGYSDGNFPAWSPDGTKIAFAANNGSGYYHLWSVAATGGENTELVANKVPGGNPGDQEPDWQPRGAVLPAAKVPPPVLGRSVDVHAVSGQVLIKLPGRAAQARAAAAAGFVPLTQARQIPVGSLLDTRRGVVSLTSAAGSGKLTYAGSFHGAVFAVGQQARGQSRGLTQLSLVEKGITGLSGCTSPAQAAIARARKLPPRVLQALHSSVHGKFRTRGRYSSATVRGTIWDTIDRCDGSLTVVHRGVVLVNDFRRRRTVRLTAGHRYLAKAP